MADETRRDTRERPGYARSSIREQTDRMKERAREAGREARETAGRKAEELKQRAAQATDELTSRVGTRVAALARALRRAGEELRGEGETRFAELMEQGARQMERIGSYLDGRQPNDMLADLEDMARRTPALFVGSTFALGVLAGRWLRADEPAAEVVFEPEGDWGLDGGPGDEADEAVSWSSYTAADPGLGEGEDAGAAVTSERMQPERAMTPDIENISDAHPSSPPPDEHEGDETPVRTPYAGHETTGPGIRTGSSGAAALDAGSAGPRQGERDLRPMRRRADRKEAP